MCFAFSLVPSSGVLRRLRFGGHGWRRVPSAGKAGTVAGARLREAVLVDLEPGNPALLPEEARLLHAGDALRGERRHGGGLEGGVEVGRQGAWSGCCVVGPDFSRQELSVIIVISTDVVCCYEWSVAIACATDLIFWQY